MTTERFPEPAGARFPADNETEVIDGVTLPVAAVDTVTTLVAVLQQAFATGGADLFPAIVQNEDGSEDIAVVISVTDPASNRTAVYVAGVLFNTRGSSPQVLAWANLIKERVLAQLDAENHAEADRLRDAEVDALEAEDRAAAQEGREPDYKHAVDAALNAVTFSENHATPERYLAEDGES